MWKSLGFDEWLNGWNYFVKGAVGCRFCVLIWYCDVLLGRNAVNSFKVFFHGQCGSRIPLVCQNPCKQAKAGTWISPSEADFQLPGEFQVVLGVHMIHGRFQEASHMFLKVLRNPPKQKISQFSLATARKDSRNHGSWTRWPFHASLLGGGRALEETGPTPET